MIKSIYKLGATTISLLSLALLFKIMHWAGGNIMLIVTLAGLVPLTAFMTAVHFSRQEDEEKERYLYKSRNSCKIGTSIS